MKRQIHTVATEEVYHLLRSHADGLDAAEAVARFHELGPNRLEATRQFSLWKSLARQFTNFFSLLLDAAAVLCFVADAVEPGGGMFVLGIALAVVSVLNALFSFLQEARAERAMQELRKFLPAQVLVWRAGKELEVPAEQLVPGDLLSVSEGDRVPADARVVDSEGLLVNNASLTGESRPVPIVSDPVEGRLIDAKNVVFAGSTVLRGNARAVVFATGRRTQFGQIAAMSVEIERPETPLEKETARMVRTLTIIAVTMGVLFFIYGLVAGRSLWVNLVFGLGIIVANVPEGLLPTFTLALAVGAVRLARKKVLVKSLSAVEALGSIQVLCTDKTGTLTLNQLAVSGIVDPIDGTELDAEHRRRVLHAALVASELKLKEGQLSGDPLDVALADSFSKDSSEALNVVQSCAKHFPFDVQRRNAAGIGKDASGELCYAVKGAWESLRSMLLVSDDSSLDRTQRIIEELASNGQRVIAVAARRLGEQPDCGRDELESGLQLLGLIALHDPLRPEVPDAMARCRTAGIRVVLITGDHPETARAIAEQAGMLEQDARGVLTGDELEAYTLQQLADAFNDGTRIFARTTPEQKMKIVSALKRTGLVVGMTGDGVNDAPALKAADVGIAMGERGTDVAREAAQVVLLDDNFASIVRGIEEGRAIFENIRKFTNYVLVSNGPEIIPYILYVLFPVPLALTIIQILVIDLGTDIVPSMALGQEPAEPDTMQRPPRSRDQRLLSGSLMAHSYGFLGLIEAGYALFLFFFVLVRGGWSWGQDLDATDPLYRSATGICLATIMLMQVGNFIGRRSRTRSGLDSNLFKNRLTLLGFSLEIAFAYCVLYVPVVGDVLGTGPVPYWIFGLAALGAPVIFGADYLRKLLARRIPSASALATAH